MKTEMEKSYIELYDALEALVTHLGWMESWNTSKEKVWRSDSPREILAYEALKNAKSIIEKLDGE